MDDVSAPDATPRTDQTRGDRRYRLPSYISPGPSHLDEHELEFLARKDCFTIPDDPLRDELIRIYVFVIYPFMPAVDLVDFLEPITGSSEAGSGPVSLLLFQAVMFSGIIYVDTQLLQSCGYESKRAARKAFFNRVKLLYSLGYETDRLTLVQSLLLMTFWYDSDGDDKHTWYWMGLALTTAHVEGLHRDLAQQMTKKGRLRRRIWWSCVIRDRVMGLGIRRPCRIREDEFSVEQLRLDDFDIVLPPPPAVARLLAAPNFTGIDPANRQKLATLCIDLSKLCITIGRILYSQYTIASALEAGSDYLQWAIVRPKSSKEQAQSFAQCDTDLQDWFQSLSSASRYVLGARDGRSAGAQTENSTIRLHKILLYIIYLTALGALHRPQVFYSGEDSITNPTRKVDSRRKLTEAAVITTKLAFDLKSNDQLRYAPTSSISAFLSAALIHLLNTRSSDEEIQDISIGRFCQCLDTLHQLQNMYAAADQAVQIINNMLEAAGFMLPLLGIGNPMSMAGRSTMGDRMFAGGGANNAAGRNSRLSSEMRPTRVATAYSSPAPATGNLDASQEETLASPVAGAGSMGDIHDVRPAGRPPNSMSIWSAGGHLHSERDMPLPADLMAGVQLDLDAWHDMGDMVDPAMMNFGMWPDFLDCQGLPM
jgi:hypothetical protein